MCQLIIAIKNKGITMKYFLLITIILSGALLANTQELLIEVNPQWNKYTESYSPKHTYSPKTEKELVKLHLLNAIELIKENTAKLDLNNKQLQQRNKNLEILSEYANRELFPINNIQTERTPIFVDEAGTHCAVGYLLKLDGENEIIDFVTSSNNLIKILEIENESFNSWQENSGFTMDELALIQPGYSGYFVYERDLLSIDNNAKINGNMQILSENSTHNHHFVYGSMQSIDGVDVNNIAAMIDGEWKNFGEGIATEIKGMAYLESENGTQIFACGNDILPTGFKNDIAVFDPESGFWMSVGLMTDGVVNQIVFHDGIGYAVGEFSMAGGVQTDNIFAFDFATQEITGFGDQFELGIVKISNFNYEAPYLLSEGDIYLLKDSKFEKQELNEKFIDLEVSNSEVSFAISDKNEVTLISNQNGNLELFGSPVYSDDASNLASYKKSYYNYELEETIYWITKKNDKNFLVNGDLSLSAVSHFIEVDDNSNYFMMNTSFGSQDEEIHLFHSSSENNAKYEKLTALYKSLPLELEKFDVLTNGNRIQFEINSKNIENFEIQLVDLQGNVVGEKSVNNSYLKDNFAVESAGLYLLSADIGGKVITKKIVVGE